ncbi:SRPBCC family protein [Pseudonocardia humida]|uniref:SRPBCC domain-containing protein n=1 Tax=Pseudonocardia humida TaxID=2800819 RepID=A0ABT1A6A9_9PSEU|nr:SRPBCC domain-containing protein [Pseudonocardia humida]MCO1658539.1 SRPBCC domain-containing protein [Pseudonocardia humida]
MERPILELLVNAPREEVWRAVSTTDGLREWFGYDYEQRHGGRPERPAAGFEAELRAFVEDAEMVPPERVAFDDGTALTLAADGPRTIVRLVVPDVADAKWEDLYDGVAEGWRFYLEQLRFFLEAAPKGARRTVYLAGRATGRQVVELVGPGTPWYEASVVTPQGWLVSVGADPDDTVPGPVNVIVSTYGLDDTAFATVRDDWSIRWIAAVDEPEVITADPGSG